jgi:ketosteroid isomerase-like protein
MNNLKLPIIILMPLLLCSCILENKKGDIEKWKQEILETELNFAKMVKEEGLHKAFVAFAANDAVLMRNNNLVIGKNAIDERYKESNSKNLSWKPDFIDVSKSGDLGYTYGKYNFTYIDSIGNEHVDTGVFHSVWKRQADGTWKYVWD